MCVWRGRGGPRPGPKPPPPSGGSGAMEIGAQEPGPSPGPARSPSPRHKSKAAAPSRTPESGLRVGESESGLRVGAPSRAPSRGIRVGASSRAARSGDARMRSGARSEDRSGPGPSPPAGGAVPREVRRLPARRQSAVLRVPFPGPSSGSPTVARGASPPACAHLREPRRRAVCASHGVHPSRVTARRGRSGSGESGAASEPRLVGCGDSDCE